MEHLRPQGNRLRGELAQIVEAAHPYDAVLGRVPIWNGGISLAVVAHPRSWQAPYLLAEVAVRFGRSQNVVADPVVHFGQPGAGEKPQIMRLHRRGAAGE